MEPQRDANYLLVLLLLSALFCLVLLCKYFLVMISVVFVICLHNRLTLSAFEFGCSFLFAGNQDLFLSINKVFLFSPDFGRPVVISAVKEPTSIELVAHL